MGGTVNRSSARRARAIAVRQLAYRDWANDPSGAVIPALPVLSDPRLHERESERRLRRAQNGVFDSAVRHREPSLRHAV